jgi:hypothetical protein
MVIKNIFGIIKIYIFDECHGWELDIIKESKKYFNKKTAIVPKKDLLFSKIIFQSKFMRKHENDIHFVILFHIYKALLNFIFYQENAHFIKSVLYA